MYQVGILTAKECLVYALLASASGFVRVPVG